MYVCSYWQAKVMALSNDAKWMGLERFSKSKKPPPIGFEVCTVLFFFDVTVMYVYTHKCTIALT